MRGKRAQQKITRCNFNPRDMPQKMSAMRASYQQSRESSRLLLRIAPWEARGPEGMSSKYWWFMGWNRCMNYFGWARVSDDSVTGTYIPTGCIDFIRLKIGIQVFFSDKYYIKSVHSLNSLFFPFMRKAWIWGIVMLLWATEMCPGAVGGTERAFLPKEHEVQRTQSAGRAFGWSPLVTKPLAQLEEHSVIIGELELLVTQNTLRLWVRSSGTWPIIYILLVATSSHFP